MYELKTGNGILSGALAVLVAMAAASAWAGETDDGGLFDIRDGVLRGMKATDADEVVVPGSVKRLVYGSFRSPGYAYSRTRVVRLSEGVESIGERSFDGLRGLEKVVIPSTVTHIAYGAFYLNSQLDMLEIDPSAPFKFENGLLLDKAGKTVLFARQSLRRAEIPATVERIGEDAFWGCRKLQSISIPEGVKTIGKNAFRACESLVAVELPSSLEDLQDAAFADCPSLDRISIAGHPSLSAAGNLLLDDSGKTVVRVFGSPVEVRIPDGVTRIAPEAFSNCKTLQTVFVPDSVSEIGSAAFGYCPELQTLRLPSHLDKCGSNIANHCPKLRDLAMPEGIETLSFTYWGCKSLTRLQIPKSVETVGQQAIQGCDGLEEIVFPEGIKTFSGNGIVSECANLVRIVLPASVETISGMNIFGKNPKLETIDVSPENRFFTSVEGVLFDKDMTRLIQCPGAKAGIYEIPSSVLEINPLAFSGCRNLTEVRIPDSVRTIGYRAFGDCPAATNRIAAAVSGAAKEEKPVANPAFPFADVGMDDAGDTDGGLPIAKFPVDGIVAGFTFNDQDKADDFVKKGRKFMASGLPHGSGSRVADDLVKDGALQLPGGHAWEFHAHLGVPELRYDRFTVAMNFRPVFGGRSPLPLVSFGGGWRWFHVLLRPDGTPVVAFRGLAGGNELSFPLPAKFRPDEWNWIAVAVDVASHRLSAVVDGRRIPDIALPDDFAFRFNREEREKCRTIEFANLNNGTVFKGEINGFLLFDRAFTDDELEAIAIAPEEEEAPWVFRPGEEDAVFYWNGTVSDGLVTLDARLSDGKVSVALPDVLSVPGGVLDLRKPVLDGQGAELALVGIGEEDRGQLHVGFGGRRRDMTAVLLPETLKWIGPGAFERCKNLTSLTIPAAVERIGQKAFLDCPALEKLEFENRSFPLSNSVFGYSETEGDTRRPATNLLPE